MSRFEEVVNEAIGEVVLGEALQGRDARPAHRRARARAPGRAARRGDDRRALPRAQAGAGVGHRDAGDLHAVRLGGRVRARHAPARRRRGPGHDRLPVRAGAGRRRARASGCAADGFTDDEIERIFEAVPGRHAQPARPRHAAHRLPRGLRRRDRGRRRCSRSSRTRCRSEIYELMKRSDEVAVVEKAHRRPRFVEDCVREMIRGVDRALRRPRRRRLRLRPPGEPRDDPPAQRRRRALRAARRAAPRAELGRAPRASHVDARVAGRRRALTPRREPAPGRAYKGHVPAPPRPRRPRLPRRRRPHRPPPATARSSTSR